MASDDPSIGAEVTDLSVDAKNTVIASDRTGGGEQRHGLVDGGSSASEDPEIKGRSIPAAARRAAAVTDRIPAARRSSGGSDRQSSAARPGSDPVRRQFFPADGGGGLGRRAGGEGHQGEGKLGAFQAEVTPGGSVVTWRVRRRSWQRRPRATALGGRRSISGQRWRAA